LRSYTLLKHSARVMVDGQEFRIRSEAPSEQLQKVADVVSERLIAVKKAMGVSGVSYKAALLTALNLAGELFRERELQQEHLTKLEEQSRELLRYLDQEAALVDVETQATIEGTAPGSAIAAGVNPPG
jgi:cell division protein ZapA (FtsZ GTPase activity inhibitor)